MDNEHVTLQLENQLGQVEYLRKAIHEWNLHDLPSDLSFVPRHKKNKEKSQKRDNNLPPTVPFVLVPIQVNYHVEKMFFSLAASAYSYNCMHSYLGEAKFSY